MQKRPLVSIIIATKNEEKNITRCIGSIKKQSPLYEIIVVDNYSTDKTVTIAEKLGAKVILQGKERSEQRNVGAKKAQGKWLLFLDGDMEASYNLVSECVEVTKNALYPPMIIIPEVSKGGDFWGKALALEKNCYRDLSWIMAARFFLKKHFLSAGGFDESLNAGEDWDLTQRMEVSGIPKLIAKKTFVYHHELDVSLWELLKKEAYYIKSIGRYARKHPVTFSYQSNLLYRGFIWARSWRKLIKQPVLTLAFLFYKLIVWLMWKLSRRLPKL